MEGCIGRGKGKLVNASVGMFITCRNKEEVKVL